MKTLGIIWNVVINIITVIVVLGIFSVASTTFETIVLAVLVLIYLSIVSLSTFTGLHQIELGKILTREFRDIRKLLSQNEEDYEYKKEAKKETEKQELNLLIKVWINGVFQTIIYIITLYYLLTFL